MLIYKQVSLLNYSNYLNMPQQIHRIPLDCFGLCQVLESHAEEEDDNNTRVRVHCAREERKRKFKEKCRRKNWHSKGEEKNLR